MNLLPDKQSANGDKVLASSPKKHLLLEEKLLSLFRRFPRLSKLVPLGVHEYVNKKVTDNTVFHNNEAYTSSLAFLQHSHAVSLPALLDVIENEMRTDNHAGARALIEAALFFLPADIMLLKKLNETLIVTKTRPAILPYLKKAVACNPIDVALVCLAAEYCLQMQRLEIGISFITQELAKNVAGTSNLYRILGELEKNRNNVIPAEKALRTSLAMNPANDVALVALAHLLHTQSRLTEEDSLLAEYHGAKTMRFWIAVARVKDSLENYHVAKDAYQKATTFPSCPPYVYLNFGKMELMKGNYEEAEGVNVRRTPPCFLT